jgi:hypothetical protein
MAKQLGYEFIGNQGLGKDAMQPHSTWAKPSILDALQLATGPILCIYKGQDFVAAINVGRPLVKFGFQHTYPLVTSSSNKDVRNIGRIAFGFWMRPQRYSAEDVAKAQIHFSNKYGRRFETPDYCAAWRLLSVKPHEVGTAPLLAGLHLNGDELAASLKSRVRGLLA